MNISRLARTSHRWFAYLIAAQVLAWVAGGLLFAWLPFHPWVKAQDYVGKPEPSLPANWPQQLQVAMAGATPDSAVKAVASVVGPDGPLWRLSLAAGGTTWLRADGQAWQPASATVIEGFAGRLYRGTGRMVGGAEKLTQVPARLGLVQEMGGRNNLWRVAFDDGQSTRLYFDGSSGEFLTARTEAWVWYDLLWRLHIMDYGGGEDFNNRLLRVAAPLAFLLVLAGLVLTVQAAWRARRRRRVV